MAPMMRHTDRHLRYLLRLISPRTMLYTEMLVTSALIHGNGQRRLEFDPAEHPVGVQLGGSDPAQLRRCAAMAAGAGYDEINLNVGCPSPRVSDGRFGACLMAEPHLVADCVAAMADAVPVPATVKSRIGIDGNESYQDPCRFVAAVAAAGARTLIVHARTEWLKGLSPAKNRRVPPLRSDLVHPLKREFPALRIVINGGIASVAGVREQLAHVDGVMIGRAACAEPMLLAAVEQDLYGTEPPAAVDVLHRYLAFAAARLKDGAYPPAVLQPIAGLFRGRPGARRLRAALCAAATGSEGLDAIARTLADRWTPAPSAAR